MWYTVLVTTERYKMVIVLVIKSNRNGETYHCSVCGVELDADVNAAINILRRGVYSPSNDEA